MTSSTYLYLTSVEVLSSLQRHTLIPPFPGSINHTPCRSLRPFPKLLLILLYGSQYPPEPLLTHTRAPGLTPRTQITPALRTLTLQTGAAAAGRRPHVAVTTYNRPATGTARFGAVASAVPALQQRLAADRSCLPHRPGGGGVGGKPLDKDLRCSCVFTPGLQRLLWRLKCSFNTSFNKE